MALQASNSQQPAADWDEAQCKGALAHLEKLQEQLDELRLTIPRIIQPLRTAHTTPAAFYADFRQAAVGANKNISKFKVVWQSQETQSIFEHAKESQKTDPDLSACVRVPKYGWVDTLENEKEAAGAIEKEDQVMMLKNEELDITGIVDAFKHEHPKFKVNLEADNQLIHITDITHEISRCSKKRGKRKLQT